MDRGFTLLFGPTKSEDRMKEILLVVLQVKPAVESYRVLFDSPLPEGQTQQHEIMLALSRGSEIACESFPESVIQTTFLIANPREASILNLTSIAFSFGSMAFGMASASVDIDLEQGGRKDADYNGYVPLTNLGEFSCIASLTLVNACSIACKTAAVVAASTAVGSWAAGLIFLTEFAIVNLDALMRDEWYWDTIGDESEVGLALAMHFVTMLGFCKSRRAVCKESTTRKKRKSRLTATSFAHTHTRARTPVASLRFSTRAWNRRGQGAPVQDSPRLQGKSL